MLILGIESSCDETAAAVVEDGRRILGQIIGSQTAIHRDYGGVVPELASREHVDNIAWIVEACLQETAKSGRSVALSDLDGIAVTRGPGLMGALLVGACYAKGLAYALGRPLLGVNHLEGHIASVFLEHPEAELPALSLVVSGGHTNLYHLAPGGDCRLLARTLDDAAGEAFDKLSKLLSLGYPGGPTIDRLVGEGRPMPTAFPLPKITKGGYDFSFSGLKTAALREVREKDLIPEDPAQDESFQPGLLDLLAGFQKAIVDQLIDRLQKALDQHSALSIHLSGGVSCNSELRRRCREHFGRQDRPVYYPSVQLTTDNAAMIAAAGTARLKQGHVEGWDMAVHPQLKVSDRPFVR